MAKPSDSIAIQNVDMPLILPRTIDEVLVSNSHDLRLDTALIGLQSEEMETDTTTLTENLLIPVEDWKSGMEGSSRQNTISDNSGILTIIVVLFVAISLNFKECRKLFSHFIDELSSNKKRENAFDEHSNHETRLTILTVIQYIIYGGIILFGIATFRTFGELSNPVYSFSSMMKMIGLFFSYYLFQICSYSITGYTFAGKEGCMKWLRAFNASQSLAGAALIFPALMILFYPVVTESMFLIACVLYIIARFIFIVKGFSIFYNNIFSSVYFILYLCALEIIPVIYIYKLALLIV